MPNTQQPSNLFADLFAANGNITVIPNTNDPSTGRASLQAGFPPITQQPPSLGGIAPTRTDFNGILYMLSAFAFFAQSGGIFEYNQTLDYGTPAIIFYDNDFWVCIAENGVNKPSGVQIPADGSIYWQTLKSFLGSGGSGGNPVGTIIMFYGTTVPDGYLNCNGSSFNPSTYPELAALLGGSVTPDLRGYFLRGYDPNAVRDPDGNRPIGTEQGDAIREITGGFQIEDDNTSNAVTRFANYTGAFGEPTVLTTR